MIGRRTLLGWFLLTLVCHVGCGPSQPVPVPVSGTVELDGRPMKAGKIVLAGGGETPAELDVTDGKFEGKATPGAKKVEIRAFKLGTETKMGDTVIPAPQINIIPARYNDQSTLKAEVSDAGINPSKFEVKSN
jgi:hypothetical protein